MLYVYRICHQLELIREHDIFILSSNLNIFLINKKESLLLLLQALRQQEHNQYIFW